MYIYIYIYMCVCVLNCCLRSNVCYRAAGNGSGDDSQLLLLTALGPLIVMVLFNRCSHSARLYYLT